MKDKEVIRSKQVVIEWAKDMGLEHSSSEHYDDFISHIFVYEDSLIDINDNGNEYQLIASKEVDDFEPYLEAESDTLEGLNPYINEIKYGKPVSKSTDSEKDEIDKGFEL